ncbi:MAG: rod shape-determining protein MreC [Alphaproteobacteria bacterium]
MWFRKKPIYIKRAGYSKAARGGVEWLKWFFDHGGFWVYLLSAIIVVITSSNRLATNNIIDANTINDNIAINVSENSHHTTLIASVLSLVQNMTSHIGQSIEYVAISLGNLVYANEQNKKLRQDLKNYNLLKQQTIVLRRENLELSKLLKFQPRNTNNEYITARIIGDAGASGRQTWLVNRGGNDGITEGAFAVDDTGLVGVIIEVGNNSARLLRLSDPNFYLPVTVTNRKFRAVLRGDGSPIAILDYFDGIDRPTIGEVVVSTGNGGNFPPFLPIGTIYDKKLGKIGILIFAEKNPPIYVKIYKP